jgi:hypothetical protein
VGIFAEPTLEQRAQSIALGSARLDQRLRLEDAEHFAGDRGTNGIV